MDTVHILCKWESLFENLRILQQIIDGSKRKKQTSYKKVTISPITWKIDISTEQT